MLRRLSALRCTGQSLILTSLLLCCSRFPAATYKIIGSMAFLISSTTHSDCNPARCPRICFRFELSLRTVKSLHSSVKRRAEAVTALQWEYLRA
ncbi:hypothetical protein F5883DRAFT_262014 [Diaporthe sp. PMI_573]|nr:hypothetical protein F5883DRAFT_262014 [Diaporthaceae sp. PMI_573]